MQRVVSRPRLTAGTPILRTPEIQRERLVKPTHAAVGAVTPIANNVVLSRISDLVVGREEAFYVNDLSVVESQFARWRKLLPRVKPFYAVKCSPDQVLVEKLAALGAGFDCASKGEIQQVQSAGVKADRIIFANPCKKIGDINYAATSAVRRMTFDSVEELQKISQVYPTAELVVRLLPDDSRSLMKFGSKFGAHIDHLPEILRTARSLGMKVIGTSFHVGSGCFDATAFRDAVGLARTAFDMGANHGFNFKLLDIGGGFPGNIAPPSPRVKTAPPTFDAITAQLRPALDAHFPKSSGVEIIGEPGRYFASAWATLAVNVYAKRVKPGAGDKKILYYVNDGVYGSFNCIMFDHAQPEPRILKNLTAHLSPKKRAPVIDAFDSEGVNMMEDLGMDVVARAPASSSSTIFGPTCDSIDCIVKDYMLEEVEVGDWLVFPEMGAYSKASGSAFNGFQLPEVHYMDSRH